MSIIIEFSELEESKWWRNFSRDFRKKTRSEVNEYLEEFNATYPMPKSGHWYLTFEDEVGLSAFILRWS